MLAAWKLGFAAVLCLAGVVGSGGAPSAIAAHLPAAALLGSAARTGVVAELEPRGGRH